MFGKQDPFIRFTYDGRDFQTETKDDAGKHAVFNEVFMLEDIEKQVKAGASLVLASYDEDMTSVEWLCEIKPLPF